MGDMLTNEIFWTVVLGITYVAMFEWARTVFVQDPLRAYYTTLLQMVADRLSVSADDPVGVNLRQRINDHVEKLKGGSRPWRADQEIAAALVLREAEIHLATTEDATAIRTRMRIAAPEKAASAPADIPAGLRAALLTAIATPEIDDGSRYLVRSIEDLRWTGTNAHAALLLRAHRKTAWMVYLGTLVAVVAGISLGSPELLLAGAMGAVASRTWRFVKRNQEAAEMPSSKLYQRLPWTVMLAGPVLGALAAYGGVIVTQFLASLDILGATFDDVSRQAPTGQRLVTEMTIAVAFLFGFVERLLDQVTVNAAEQLVPASAEPAASTDNGGEGQEGDGDQLLDTKSSSGLAEGDDADDGKLHQQQHDQGQPHGQGGAGHQADQERFSPGEDGKSIEEGRMPVEAGESDHETSETEDGIDSSDDQPGEERFEAYENSNEKPDDPNDDPDDDRDAPELDAPDPRSERSEE